MSKVLVVDDNQDLADNLVEILAEFGHHAVAAYGGAEALQRASEHAFDLALVDVRMPGMDGIELVKRLIKSRPGCAYLFMSAISAEQAMTEARAISGCDVLAKPLDMDRVLDFVAHA